MAAILWVGFSGAARSSEWGRGHRGFYRIIITNNFSSFFAQIPRLTSGISLVWMLCQLLFALLWRVLNATLWLFCFPGFKKPFIFNLFVSLTRFILFIFSLATTFKTMKGRNANVKLRAVSRPKVSADKNFCSVDRRNIFRLKPNQLLYSKPCVLVWLLRHENRCWLVEYCLWSS